MSLSRNVDSTGDVSQLENLVVACNAVNLGATCDVDVLSAASGCATKKYFGRSCPR